MIKIPIIGAVILSRQEREVLYRDLKAASLDLENSAKLNVALAIDLGKAIAKGRELAGYLVDQSEVVQQIMQINLLTSGALGRVREGEEVEAVCVELSAALAEFGGPPGA